MKRLLFLLLFIHAFSQENVISRAELFPRISDDTQAYPIISPIISIVPDDALKLEKYKTLDNIVGSVFVWSVVNGTFINCLYCDMHYHWLGYNDDYYYISRFRPNHTRK